MASRKDAQNRNKRNHENVRRAIQVTATPMTRSSRLMKNAMKKIPAQAGMMEPHYRDLLERIARVDGLRKADLVDVDDASTTGPPPIPPGTIQIITPTVQAGQAGIPVHDQQRFHARIAPKNRLALNAGSVVWHSDIEGALRGQATVNFNVTDATTDAYLLFEFTKEGDHLVTARAASTYGEKMEAEVPVRVLPAHGPGAAPGAGPQFTKAGVPITGAAAHFIQPTQMYLAKGLPLHKQIPFAAELHPSDGKPFRAKKVRFVSDKDGVLGTAKVRFENGMTIAQTTHLFSTPGERKVRVRAVDESGQEAYDGMTITILDRKLSKAETPYALKEGEAPFTVDKLAAQKLGPAIDNVNGMYDGALKHAHRDIRFLVKWKRKVVRDFAVTKAIHKSFQRDASDGKIDKLKKYIKRLTRNLRAFEAFIRFFNRALNEQRRLNHFLAQTRDAIVAIRNLTKQISVQPDEQVMEKISGKRKQTVHPLHNKFETVNVNLTNSYAAIRKRLQEMGRRIQRMDGGIKNYRQDLSEMIGVLSSGKAHDQIVRTFNSHFKDLEAIAKKELVEDVDGMVELLRGIVDDIAGAQKALKQLDKLAKQLKG